MRTGARSGIMASGQTEYQEVPHAVYQYEPDATEFFSEFRKLKEGFAGGSSLLEILPMYLAFDHRVLDFGNMRA